MSGRVHAELGVLPIGTSTTSLGKYIAKAIDALKSVNGIKYEVTPMGTMIESDSVDRIFDASRAVMDALFKMGIQRVEVILKIDERHDKSDSLKDKLESIKRHSQ